MNGPQLARWIKDNHCEAVLEQCRKKSPQTVEEGDLCPANRILILAGWLQQLYHHLLHGEKWSDEDVADFKRLRTEIWENWQAITQRPPTPKVHMLVHAEEFAERYRYLGRFSEAQMESCHGEFHKAWAETHRNLSQKPGERLRRCVVSTTLCHLAG
jgi:hypothetical protein